MNRSTHTVFCRHADGRGTTHIDTVEAPDLESAILAGRQQCLRDWSSGPGNSHQLDDILCVGVAEGDIRILHWEDPTN